MFYFSRYDNLCRFSSNLARRRPSTVPESQLHARQSTPTRQMRSIPLFLIAILLLSLTACSSQGTPSVTRSSTPSPIPTTLPAGAILYQGDWSHGLDEWQATKGWKVVGDSLESDFSDNSITIPYKPTIANYAIQADIQVVSVKQDGGGYVIGADQQPDKDGYQGRVLGLLAPAKRFGNVNPLIETSIEPEEDAADIAGMQESDFEPGSGWRTYRTEVVDQVVHFLVDGTRVSRATSSRTSHLSTGPLHIICNKVIIRVRNVLVIAL